MSDSETKKKVYGIDLGTTYSAISCINEDGKPEIINNSDGEQITASVVYFESDDNIVVGETAKEQGKIDSSRVIDLIKREMGNEWRREFDGKEYTPESISAIILKYLVKGAKEAGHNVEDVVITCPAYFGDAERNATRNAGTIAGLNVIGIVDEPIAAALCYDVKPDEGTKHVLVYDLGGGTFDVTVVRISATESTVLCSDGNHRLGGADWDAALERILARKFMEACPDAGDPQEDPESRYDLHVQTERVKKKLSNSKETSVAVSHGGGRAKVVVSRAEFEEATRTLLEETIEYTDKMIDYARDKCGVQKFDEFLLVGGSTYMPQVKQIILDKYAESLGIEPRVHEPNYAVSKGAAVFGLNSVISNAVEERIQELKSEDPTKTDDEIRVSAISDIADSFTLEPSKVEIISETKIRTVASKSYGIRVLNKERVPVCRNLIKKQTAVPFSFSMKFPISQANAATLPLQVFSNDSIEDVADLEEECINAGEAIMELTPGLPQGALINITFTITEEGKLTLTAEDLTNNKSISAEFNVSGALTQEEIEQQRNIVGDLTLAD